MAEGGVSGNVDEKETLGRSAKNQHKYGTATKAVATSATPDLFVKHIIQKDETLPGIALKYGRTVQQLKSVNNLWSEWQIGMRDFILIPVSQPNNQQPSSLAASCTPDSTEATTHQEYVTRQELATQIKMLKSSSDSRIADNTVSGTNKSLTNEANGTGGSIQDYFSKYDSSLAKIKDNIDKMEQTINSRQDSDNPLLLLPNRKSVRSSRGRSWKSDIESLDPQTEPELRFSSPSAFSSPASTNGTSTSSRTAPMSSCSDSNGTRRTQPYTVSSSAWQRLEQTHDELFQL